MTHAPLWFEQPVGLLRITGPDKIALVHRMCSQDIRPLSEPNQATWALFLTDKGRLIDQVQIVSTQDALLVHTSPHRAQVLAEWLSRYTIMDDVAYTVLGEAISSFTQVIHNDTQARAAQAVRAALGLTGGLGTHQAEVMADESLWVIAAPKALGHAEILVAPSEGQAALARAACVAAMGPGLDERARKDLQMTAGIPSPLAEYAGQAAPFELRMGRHSIHWHKGCYIGQEVISRLEAYDKVARLMMGIQAPLGAADLAAHAGAYRLRQGDTPIGKLTSWVPSLTGLGFVGLCLVKREFAAPQAITLVADGAKTLNATLVDCPQWQPE